MRALEFVRDRSSKEPYKKFVDRLVEEAVKNGLLIMSAGVYGNVVRLVPPINIDFEVFDRGIEILESCIKRLVQELIL